MNSKKYIALENVYFSFTQAGKPFFENISINFTVGRINFVCGKNGMGKSTLLKILSGHANIDNVSGVLRVDTIAYDVKKLHDISQSIAMVSQNFNAMLVDSYSFYENLQIALLSMHPSLLPLPKPLPLPAFVEKYGINPNIAIHLLSGGQRQILSMLMVLQRSPKILLLDEPTAALDEENATLVLDFLQDLCLQEDVTIIAIVHDVGIVEKYAGSSYFELYQRDGIRDIRDVIIV